MFKNFKKRVSFVRSICQSSWRTEITCQQVISRHTFDFESWNCHLDNSTIKTIVGVPRKTVSVNKIQLTSQTLLNAKKEKKETENRILLIIINFGAIFRKHDGVGRTCSLQSSRIQSMTDSLEIIKNSLNCHRKRF